MNQNSLHRSMNGFPPQSTASASPNSYQDFPPMHRGPQGYPNNPGMHHHPTQQPPPHMHHNQWHQSMQQPHLQQLPPHQQGYNQSPAWGMQMQQQNYPPGMPGLAGFNLPFLPQQVLQDAFTMSAPVESADEMTLVTTLISSLKKGESYKDALNSLHGKNGHASSLWKDYYLDHKERLDAWISSCLKDQRNGSKQDQVRELNAEFKFQKATIKKPSLATFKTEHSPAISPQPSASAPVKQRKQSLQPTPPLAASQAGRRNTINSITAPAPVYGNRLPAPNAEIQIPDPPSRSPSPPTRIIPHRGRGNKYTQEDRDFFIKFISWRLKQDSSLTRLDLCNLLAEKAPHHTSQSWASHWSNNHDIPDKILAAARGDEYISGSEDEDSDTSEEKIPVPRRRPVYRELSSDEDDSERDGEGSEEDVDKNEENGDDDGDDDDDDTPLKEWDRSEMGQRGGPFTEADFYFAAKHIASFINFEDTSSKDRWDPFHERYSQRSAKSWAEYYRRNERPINKLVQKIKRLRENEKIKRQTDMQCGQTSLVPPKAKRKHDIEGDENDSDRTKRGRGENSKS